MIFPGACISNLLSVLCHGGYELPSLNGSLVHQCITTRRIYGTFFSRDKPFIAILDQNCIKNLMVWEAGAQAFETLPMLEQGLTSCLRNLICLLAYSSSLRGKEELLQKLTLHLLPLGYKTSRKVLRFTCSSVTL